MHGWREFLGEVGIIVVGVLIALGFEAIVDDLNWSAKVAEARTQLRREVALNLALLDNRISQQACVSKRIDELAVIITKASQSGHLGPLGEIEGPGGYTFPVSVWESQMAAQTIAHFPAAETAAISRAYRFIGSARYYSDAEHQAWITLGTIAGPGRPLDSASASRLIEALDVARSSNSAMAPHKVSIEGVLVKGGLGRDFPQPDPNNPPVLPKGMPGICKPIGTPRSTY